MTTEADPDIDTRCWISLDESIGTPCNRPADNGAGICDYHLELLRRNGK